MIPEHCELSGISPILLPLAHRRHWRWVMNLLLMKRNLVQLAASQQLAIQRGSMTTASRGWFNRSKLLKHFGFRSPCTDISVHLGLDEGDGFCRRQQLFRLWYLGGAAIAPTAAKSPQSHGHSRDSTKTDSSPFWAAVAPILMFIRLSIVIVCTNVSFAGPENWKCVDLNICTSIYAEVVRPKTTSSRQNFFTWRKW